MIGIIGNGGHAKVITDIYKRIEPTCEIVYFSSQQHIGLNVNDIFLDTEENIIWLNNRVKRWHVAIGDPYKRKEKLEFLLNKQFSVFRAIHDQCAISNGTLIGKGTSIMAGVVINTSVYVGLGCIINTKASIDHDCLINDYVNIGPGCTLTGGVRIGALSNIGAGAIIIPNISVGERCVIGAGAVVIDDIPDGCLAVGNPARIIRR